MAFANPYTYSDLQRELFEIERISYMNLKFARETLCKTLAGTPVDLLTISSLGDNKEKRGVIFTARVHPGETVGSWMMKGIIDFLLSDDKEAVWLRENFIFKLIPMLNPDGVIQGNYRCSFAGCDLNRKYNSPSKVE